MTTETAYLVVTASTIVALIAYFFVQLDDTYRRPSKHWRWVLWYGLANLLALVFKAWLKIVLG